MRDESLRIHSGQGKQAVARRRHRKRTWLRKGILIGILFLLCAVLWRGLCRHFEGLSDIYAGTGIFSEGEDNGSLAGSLSKEDYPESLLELLERNPETKQFVLDYPEKKEASGRIDVSEEITKGEIPLFLQWDERWGYRQYGNDFMALNGCGPACLSMVRCGLSGSGKWNPYKVAKLLEEEGYYVKGEGTLWTSMTNGAEAIGLTVYQVVFSEEGIRDTLEKGRPVICVVGPGDFTTTGHFLVLTGIDENGEISLCDPNSRKNSEKAWPIEVLMSQIRNLWAYSYEAG